MQRIRQHCVLAVVNATLGAGIFFLLSSLDVLFKLSMASAYTSLAFLGASLVLGPWNILKNRPNPISTNLRRDIGIWAGVSGLFHVIVGLQVHMRGKLWLYFIYPPEERHLLPFRHDPFGFANYTGLVATFALLLLLSLSNNLSLRRLGTRRWKSLQRWNYPCVILVVLHGLAYQLIEKRDLFFVAMFVAMTLAPGALQIAGYRIKRCQKGARQDETLTVS